MEMRSAAMNYLLSDKMRPGSGFFLKTEGTTIQ
jgi:hypothetical protein